ncbi:MAG: hypothetical protein AB1673_14585 [Actinomycetota bacterium]
MLISAGAVLSGCRSTATHVATTTKPTGSTTTARFPDEFVVGDHVPLGDAGGSVTVQATETGIDPGRLFAPPRGRQYFAAKVKGCAGSTEHDITFEADYFSIRLADHTVYPGAEGVKKPALPGGTIPPGGCLDGWITFTIPTGQPPLAIIYDGSLPVTWTLTRP